MVTIKEKIAIFDVDGTLSNSFYLIRFAFTLFEEGIFPKSELNFINDKFEEYRQGGDQLYEPLARDIVEAFGRGIKGRTQRDIEQLGKMHLRLHPQEKASYANNLVGMVKDKGYRTVVISGSPSEIILPFSKRLGIDDVFATTYEVQNGRFTGAVVQNCAVSETKGQVLQEYVQKHDVDMAASCGFGDSHSDMAFLGEVGHPVALNPSKTLEQIAMEQMSKGRVWLICHGDDERVLTSISGYIP